jgi:uncharacterized protein YutE (UPF0331/DUF86 family)
LINKDRILKLLKDFKELKNDIIECIDTAERCEDEKIKKLLYHSIRAYFLDFHILCEDYISINLKAINKFRIDISAIEGMEIINKSNNVSDNFLNFYITSRRLRNRLAHRYKMPKDEELLLNLKNNIFYIDELEEEIKKYI